MSPDAARMSRCIPPDAPFLGGIEELGGSGYRGSIRLVKLVWLVLPKTMGNRGKGPIYKKTVKTKKKKEKTKR